MNQYLVKSRRQELDWLRVFAILALVFYHTGLLFGPWTWDMKNPETNENYAYWMAFLHGWRMPLLFFISGAGTFFAFGKFNTPRFIVERVKRLIVPLIFGMVVILPPQDYYQHIQEYDNYWDFYKSVLDYIPYYQGVANLHHLWFLSHLFIFSLLGIPVILLLRSTYADSLKATFLDFLFNPIVLLLLPPVLILATQIMFVPFHPGRAHFAFYCSFFLAGIICYSSTFHVETIGNNRKLFLFSSIVSLVPIIILYKGQGQIYPFESHTLCSPLEVIAIFAVWFLVMTLIGYGQYYLKRTPSWFTRVSEATYPVYILHQTVIIVIGYYMGKLPWGINTKFWSVSLLTMVICILLYELVIRPFNVMRFLFGLKLKPQKSKVAVAGQPD